MNRPFAPSDGARRGPEHYWTQIKRFGSAGFTVRELHDRCQGVAWATVKVYVRTLRDLGVIRAIDVPDVRSGRYAAIRYAIAKDLAQAPVMRHRSRTQGDRGQRQQHLWNAMRGLSSFLIRELAAVASTEDLTVSIDMAHAYVTPLRKAGLVLTVGVPDGAVNRGPHPGRYRLKPSANTGGLPPKIIGNRVFDPNKRRFVGEAIDGSEVSA